MPSRERGQFDVAPNLHFYDHSFSFAHPARSSRALSACPSREREYNAISSLVSRLLHCTRLLFGYFYSFPLAAEPTGPVSLTFGLLKWKTSRELAGRPSGKQTRPGLVTTTKFDKYPAQQVSASGPTCLGVGLGVWCEGGERGVCASCVRPRQTTKWA